MAASAHYSSTLARRYAKALFDLANEQQKLDGVAADLQKFVDMAGADEALQGFLKSPVNTRDDSANAAASLLKQMKADALTERFFAVLARHRRLPIALSAAREFHAMLSRERGEVMADVETAAPLSKANQDELIAALSKATGKKVSLSIRENPALIGGLSVAFDGQRLDLSLKGRLERLEQTLKAGAAA